MQPRRQRGSGRNNGKVRQRRPGSRKTAGEAAPTPSKSLPPLLGRSESPPRGSSREGPGMWNSRGGIERVATQLHAAYPSLFLSPPPPPLAIIQVRHTLPL